MKGFVSSCIESLGWPRGDIRQIELSASAEEIAVPRRTRGAPCLIHSEFGKRYSGETRGTKLIPGVLLRPSGVPG